MKQGDVEVLRQAQDDIANTKCLQSVRLRLWENKNFSFTQLVNKLVSFVFKNPVS
jgi:hypothetical protein